MGAVREGPMSLNYSQENSEQKRKAWSGLVENWGFGEPWKPKMGGFTGGFILHLPYQ